jgi:hypothetical protein
MNNKKIRYRPVCIALMILFFMSFSASAAEDGTLKWKYSSTTGWMENPLSIGPDGTIYIGVRNSESGSDALHAIRPEGNQKWQLLVDNAGYITIGANGTIYMSSVWGLYAINPNGTQKWYLEDLGGYAIGADDTLYFPSYGDEDPTGYLYAINPDGTQKWVLALDIDMGLPIIGADGTIYAGSNSLYAINPDGTQKWALLNDSGGRPRAIGPDGTIYAARDPDLLAINPDGTLNWAFRFDEWGLYGGPVVGPDGTIYVVSADGLHAINPSGTQKWAVPFNEYYIGDVAIGADGTIYLASGDGLYAINPNRTQRWFFPVEEGSIHPLVIGADGTIYAHSFDTLYAINTSSSGPADSSWPMFQHDARHTGQAGSVSNGCALDTKFEETTITKGIRYYTDRNYYINSGVPSWMEGRHMIKTPNDERFNDTDSGYIQFKTPVSWWVYVLFDSRASENPYWLDGWEFRSQYKIYTSLKTQPHFQVWRKYYEAGDCVDLGGNFGPGSSGENRSNYVVVYGKDGSTNCTLNQKFGETAVKVGAHYYTDRTYTIADGVPSWMVGRTLIQTPNAEKENSAGNGYIRFKNPVDWWVYVLFDSRSSSVPDWLNSWDRYTKYPEMETSLVTQPGLKMYRKKFDAGQCVDLGGNYGPGSSSEYRSNYAVVYGK